MTAANDDVHLRAAAPADAEAVAEVLIASRAAYLPFAPSAHPPDDVRRWVRETLLPRHDVTVADRGGTIVGVLATSNDGEFGWINQLFLRPGWLRRGLGSLLLAVAHARLPRPIRLYTFQPNHGARAFYERHGYRAVAFGDGSGNEESCPDVLYELA